MNSAHLIFPFTCVRTLSAYNVDRLHSETEIPIGVSSNPTIILPLRRILAYLTKTIGRRRRPRHGAGSSSIFSKLGRSNRHKMGNESSTLVDDSTPPDTLSSRTIAGLAEYIQSPKCKRIVILSGAGISTSAGIPDFRSPETGLYANLARLNLPYAEAVFDISYFRQNPLPFYTLAQELYPGKYRPTITHSFIRLLYEKKMLLKHFTQNIDCLDREAGVPGSHIIEAHGSFARQSCIECKEPYPQNLMDEAVQKKEPPHCLTCMGLVKPEIVFFGEALPGAFFEARDLPSKADLVVVLGTSLQVQPFASLPGLVPDGVPRVLINLEQAGGLGSRPDDVLLLGDCDQQVRKLAEACGWLGELEELWKSVGGKPKAGEDGEKNPRTDETVGDEIDQLTEEVDKTLSLSEKHTKETKEGLEKKVEQHVAGKTEEPGNGPGVSDGATETKETAAGSKDEAPGDKAKADDSLSHVYPHLKSNLS